MKTEMQRLIDAATALIDAYGGDVPDWLEDEVDDLAEAITAARAALAKE